MSILQKNKAGLVYIKILSSYQFLRAEKLNARIADY